MSNEIRFSINIPEGNTVVNATNRNQNNPNNIGNEVNGMHVNCVNFINIVLPSLTPSQPSQWSTQHQQPQQRKELPTVPSSPYESQRQSEETISSQHQQPQQVQSKRLSGKSAMEIFSKTTDDLNNDITYDNADIESQRRSTDRQEVNEDNEDNMEIEKKRRKLNHVKSIQDYYKKQRLSLMESLVKDEPYEKFVKNWFKKTFFVKDILSSDRVVPISKFHIGKVEGNAAAVLQFENEGLIILQKTKVNEPDEDNNVNRYRVYRIIPYEAIKAIKFYDDLIKKAIIKLKFDVDSQIIKLVNESSNSKYERIIDEDFDSVSFTFSRKKSDFIEGNWDNSIGILFEARERFGNSKGQTTPEEVEADYQKIVNLRKRERA